MSIIDDENEPTDFTFEAIKGANLLLWGESLEDVKSRVERYFRDPTGVWIFQKGIGKVFEYHGPLVTP